MRFLILLLLALGLPVAAFANGPFYVAPATATVPGNDSNNCTSAGTPCLTIAHASSLITAPATVNVAPGVYGHVETSANGSAGNLIVYQCTTIGACIIRPLASDVSDNVICTGCVAGWGNGSGTGSVRGDYVTIDGFEIDGTVNLGGTPWNMGIYSWGDHTTLTHNIVHHIATAVACTTNGGSALQTDSFYGGGSNSLIDSNVVHDIGPTGCVNLYHAVYLSAPSVTVSNNILNNIFSGSCVTQYHNVSASVIVNNTLGPSCKFGVTLGTGEWWGSAGAPGFAGSVSVQVSSGSTLTFTSTTTGIQNGWQIKNRTQSASHSTWNCWPANTTVTNVNITSNTVLTLSNPITCTVLTGDLLNAGPANTSNVVSNNIIYGDTFGIWEVAGASINNNSVYTNNNMFGNGTDSQLNQNTITNAVTGNPLMVYENATAGGPVLDYHLTASSPGKVAGTHTNAPTLDLVGITRPNPPSVGALEYVSPSPWSSIGPSNMGSAGGPAGAGNPAGFRVPQLQLQGYSYLNEYGNCVSFLNSNVGASTPSKALCLNNLGQFVIYSSNGNKLATFWDNGSISFGNFANTHGNSGATCTSNIGLSASSGAGVVQTCRYVLGAVNTTSAQVKQLTSDGAAAGATNCVNMPDNTAGAFSIQAVAIDVTTPANVYGTTYSSGVFKRGTGVGSFALVTVATEVTQTSGTTTGADFILAADTTNGCFKLTYTNPATADIWNSGAYVDIIESPPQ